MSTAILLVNRFYRNVIESDTCWLWTGRNKAGYGMFDIESRPVYAHRFSYVLQNGEIPEGLELDHLCRNTSCVNPDHLEAVTHKVNVLRGNGWSGRNARKTHCNRGHLLSGANLYVEGINKRRCRICHRENHQIPEAREQQRNYRKRTLEHKREYMNFYRARKKVEDNVYC